jgi:hypothetical protein
MVTEKNSENGAYITLFVLKKHQNNKFVVTSAKNESTQSDTIYIKFRVFSDI